MKLTENVKTKKAPMLKVNDFFVGKTVRGKNFSLRQVVRTEYGYGILKVDENHVYCDKSLSIESALQQYSEVQKVTLDEVIYTVTETVKSRF